MPCRVKAEIARTRRASSKLADRQQTMAMRRRPPATVDGGGQRLRSSNQRIDPILQPFRPVEHHDGARPERLLVIAGVTLSAKTRTPSIWWEAPSCRAPGADRRPHGCGR